MSLQKKNHGELSDPSTGNSLVFKVFCRAIHCIDVLGVTRASGAASNIKTLLVEPYPRVHDGQLPFLLIRPLLRSPRDVASPITTTTVQKRQQKRRQRPENRRGE
jgi:hypothetical protein